jgi:hypothetical protein
VILLFEILKNLFIKWYLYSIFSLFASNLTEPIKNYFYYCVEEQGVLFAFECKKRTLKEIIKEIKEYKEVVLIYQDLPTVDQVWMFCQEDNGMYLEFISYARKYLNKKRFQSYTWEQKQRYLYEYEVICNNIKMYDLMDDIKRNYVTLGIKRIKLLQLKELGGFKTYEEIKLPHIVPPEFIPDLKKD